MVDQRAEEGIRFAVLAASDPSVAIRRWKALSGRKAVGCPARYPVPEIWHGVGMLPLLARQEGNLRSLGPWIDEWAVLPDPVPSGLEEALDWVESVAERAEALSGEPCTEGAVEKSVRVYRERDALAAALKGKCATDPQFLAPGVLSDLIDAGRVLPVETHAVLLGEILYAEGNRPTGRDSEGFGDPFLFLARRVLAEMHKRT